MFGFHFGWLSSVVVAMCSILMELKWSIYLSSRHCSGVVVERGGVLSELAK